MPFDASRTVFSRLFVPGNEADTTSGDQHVERSQKRRAGRNAVSSSCPAGEGPHGASAGTASRPVFDAAMRMRWRGYLDQLDKTIKALQVPAGHKATLMSQLAQCRTSFDDIDTNVQAVLEAEGHGSAGASAELAAPDAGRVMGAAMKLAQSCDAAIRNVNELREQVEPHVHKRDVLKIVALAVGGLIAIAAGAAITMALWPVVIPALTVGGIAMLAMTSSTIAAGAVGGAIAAAYCAWDIATHPEAYRHFPQRQPELSDLLTAIGHAAGDWIQRGDCRQQDFSWEKFAMACGGEEQAHLLARAISNSGLPDTVKGFIVAASEPAGDHFGTHAGHVSEVNASRSAAAALSADELADMYGGEWGADALDRSSGPDNGASVSNVEMDDQPELYTREEIIELYWHHLGFADRNPRPAEGSAVEEIGNDDGDGEPISDNVLRREASTSTIASDTSYTTVFGLDDEDVAGNAGNAGNTENADKATPARYDDPAAGPSQPAATVTTVTLAAPAPPVDVRAEWEESKRWADRVVRNAKCYLANLAPGLTEPFPRHISEPEVKVDIMARTIAATALLEVARADVAALDAAYRTRSDAFARKECLGRLAIILKMENTQHLNADVGGLGVLDDANTFVPLSSLPQSDAVMAGAAWQRAAAEASSLLDDLDRACTHAFKHSFRGKLTGNANREFRSTVVSRSSQLQAEMKRLVEQFGATETAPAVMLSMA